MGNEDGMKMGESGKSPRQCEEQREASEVSVSDDFKSGLEEERHCT